MTDTSNIDDTAKPFWASQTVWSSLAALGASLAGALLALKAGDIAGLAAGLTGAIGAANAIAGRFRANGPLKPLLS